MYNLQVTFKKTIQKRKFVFPLPLSIYKSQTFIICLHHTVVVSHSQNTEMHFTDFSFTPFYCFSIYSNIKSYHNLHLQIPRRFLVSLFRFNKFIARADCRHKGSSVDQWAGKWKNLPSHLQRNFFDCIQAVTYASVVLCR